MDSESVSSNQTDQSTVSVITSVRYDRSRIAAEAQQLANRIRLLKSEEAKALKRVENTKKRAKELVIAREEMAQSLEERRLAVEHHNRQEALKQEQLQVDRERIKAQILQNRERRVRAKQRDAVRVKQQRAQDLEDLRKRNLEEAERVKIQSLLVREERDERRQKLQKLKIAQEERSREIYSAKVCLHFHTFAWRIPASAASTAGTKTSCCTTRRLESVLLQVIQCFACVLFCFLFFFPFFSLNGRSSAKRRSKESWNN